MDKALIILLVAFNICHWAGDFTHLSRPWMLKAKATGSPLLPILAHAAVHAVLMAGVVWAMFDLWTAALIGAVQLSSHFAIDVTKGKLNVWFPSLKNTMAYPHWMVFGADQFLHQMVIIASVTYLTYG